MEAAVTLHQEHGPAQTSLSAVAERAGVQRATLYKHFPEERDLLLACSGHYFAQHPPPDPTPWLSLSDPAERLRRVLSGLYAYFEGTEPMTSKALRDQAFKPVLAEIAESQRAQLTQLVPLLRQGWPVPPGSLQLLDAALAHALDFRTWHALSRGQHLRDEDIVRLMLAMVQGTTSRPV